MCRNDNLQCPKIATNGVRFPFVVSGENHQEWQDHRHGKKR